MTPPPKLIAAFRLLGSPVPEEREAAAHGIFRLLGQEGIHDLANKLEHGQADPWFDGFAKQREERQDTSLSDQWRDVLDQIFTRDGLLTEWEDNFVRSLYSQLARLIRDRPTPSQHAVLERIYRKLFGKGMPL